MSFTSLKFVLFLLISVVLYYLFPRKIQKYVLLAVSLAFYCSFGYKALILMLVGTVIAYCGAHIIDRVQSAKLKMTALTFFVLLEAGMLIGLKYISEVRERFSLVIPIGISFYTLSVIGYLIDVKRGKYKPEKNPFKFLLYVSYFPHILQGPIARYDMLVPQFDCEHKADYKALTFGIQLMLWGYIKKLVIADRVGIFVDTVYSDIYTKDGTVLFIAALLYTIQIYMDFSGCVDIALGASELFGIKLTRNFSQPYMAVSINDFWKRWHISLSSWFRDYIYIPLGGNRKGTVRRWINVLIVFAVSGFWHGVGISYTIWGLLHGLYQVIGAVLKPAREKAAELFKMDKSRGAYKCFRTVVTFFLVNEAWIFFRITDFKQAVYVFVQSLCDLAPYRLTDGSLYNYGINVNQWHILIVFIAAAVIADILHEKQINIREAISKQHIIVRWIIYLAAVFSILLFGVYGIGYDAKSFIYMNF